jgi:hemimethylated DNA binding protein
MTTVGLWRGRQRTASPARRLEGGKAATTLNTSPYSAHPLLHRRGPPTLQHNVPAGPSADRTIIPSRDKKTPAEGGDPFAITGLPLALEALSQLQLLEKRLQFTYHKTLDEDFVPYTLEVGDVVRHVRLGQIGTVAARFPVCLESNSWVERNLGSQQDTRMRYPWYLILVARHEGIPADFIRYGSQLTHVKVSSPMSIGFHRTLPIYFRGYDTTRGVYIPRFQAEDPVLEDLISSHGGLEELVGACEGSISNTTAAALVDEAAMMMAQECAVTDELPAVSSSSTPSPDASSSARIRVAASSQSTTSE